MKSKVTFTHVQAGRASEDIALQIESAILNQQLVEGDVLPSERELQQDFGTGRGVIREAIKTLKQKGLIEIRKGAKGGAYVKKLDVSNVSESLALFLKQNSISVDQVSEFRESIDQTVAILAISRSSDQQKVEFQQLVEQLQTLNSKTPCPLDEIGEIDRQLNLQLSAMSGNVLFQWVMHALQQGFSSSDHQLYDDPIFRQHTVANWHETATHLLNSDPLKLSSAISHHYRLLRECVDRKHHE